VHVNIWHAEKHDGKDLVDKSVLKMYGNVFNENVGFTSEIWYDNKKCNKKRIALLFVHGMAFLGLSKRDASIAEDQSSSSKSDNSYPPVEDNEELTTARDEVRDDIICMIFDLPKYTQIYQGMENILIIWNWIL